jgi:diaminohydroxyphosphoribosylaminopyrimidine deaminase/5-amino-6-(5-phosphoribosylamino)uracil reductase
MRSLNDAIMIGVGTACDDDPLLTIRLPGVAQTPLRVVLDSRLELPLGSRLAATAREFPTLVVATAAGSAAREAALAAKGVETARVEPDPAGGVDLGATLRLLGQRGRASSARAARAQRRG